MLCEIFFDRIPSGTSAVFQGPELGTRSARKVRDAVRGYFSIGLQKAGNFAKRHWKLILLLSVAGGYFAKRHWKLILLLSVAGAALGAIAYIWRPRRHPDSQRFLRDWADVRQRLQAPTAREQRQPFWSSAFDYASMMNGPFYCRRPPPQRRNLHEPFQVFSGYQADSAGPVDRPCQNRVFNRLLHHPRRPSSVIFNARLKKGRIKGGNCSAYVVDFLARLKAQKRKDTFFPTRIADAGQYFIRQSDRITSEMRSTQGAMNCIQQCPGSKPADFDRDKIQALVNFKGLRVAQAFQALSIPALGQSNYDAWVQQVTRTLDHLGTGTFFLRTLAAPRSSLGRLKGEEYGHSMVYINKGQYGRYLFEPNNGCAFLSPHNYGGEMAGHLLENAGRWSVDSARFYKIKSA